MSILNSVFRKPSRKELKYLIPAALLLVMTLTVYTANIRFAAVGIIMVLGFVFLAVSREDLFRKIPGRNVLIFVVFCCAIFVISQFSLGSIGFFALRKKYILLCCLCPAILCLGSYIICGRFGRSLFIGSFLLMILVTVNRYVYQFRGHEFAPVDFMAWETAFNVAGEYDFSVPIELSMGWFMWLFVFCAASKYKDREIVAWRSRWKWIAAEVIMMAVWYLIASNMTISSWSNQGTHYKGYFANFSAQIVELFRDRKPEGYDPAAVEQMAEGLAVKKDKDEDLVDVIVIMNESFADLRILGDGYQTQEPVMPFFDSLVENTTKGYALASVLGGGTANSEYELLTGNTCNMLMASGIVYSLYIDQPTYSLAQHFSSLGYETVATHPYLSTGWSRTKVYPLMGFDKYSFVEDYPQQNMMRAYVSDQEMYEYIIDQYKNKQSDNLFLFGITMQNHGPYTYQGENYTPRMEVTGIDGKDAKLEQYLGLIHESDKALETLISYFEGVDEKVVIVFFGDHYPAIIKDYDKQIHGGALNTLEEQLLEYTVPFFVWTNYDSEERTIPLTSLNYLSNYLFEAAGMEKPVYNQILSELEEQLPAVSSQGYYSKANGTFLSLDEAEGIEAEYLEKYKMLIYNSLFDEENRNETIFPVRYEME